MASFCSTRFIEQALLDRGLLPKDCRLVEVSITPASAIVVRYEKYVRSEELGLFAEALREAADKAIAADAQINK